MKRCFLVLATTTLLLSRAAWADGAAAAVCTVEPRAGISQEDAEAVEEVVCSVVRSRIHDLEARVRVARLGGKVVLTLLASGQERQLVLSGLDEVPVAAPRLVDAILENKSVAETQSVTNIVGIETRALKKKPSILHVDFGALAVGAVGAELGAGAYLALTAGSPRWSFVADARVAGVVFNVAAAGVAHVFTLGTVDSDVDDDGFGFGSLAAGARHHTSEGDTALFAGLGVALDELRADKHADISSGLAFYGELGVDVLRSHAVGGTIGLRFDAPTFSVERDDYVEPMPGAYPVLRTTSEWTPVVSLACSLRF